MQKQKKPIAKKPIAKKPIAQKPIAKKPIANQIQSAFKQTIKKIDKLEKNYLSQEQRFANLNSSIINIEKIANRMKSTIESQAIISKKFVLIEDVIQKMKSDFDQSSILESIIKTINSEVNTLSKSFLVEIKRIDSEIEILSKQIQERALKVDELLQNVTSFNLEANISKDQLKNIENLIMDHSNQLSNTKLQIQSLSSLLEEKFSFYDEANQKNDANRSILNNLNILPDSFNGLQLLVNNLELKIDENANSRKRMENRFIQFESSLKELSSNFQNETLNHRSADTNFHMLNKKITELASNFAEEKNELLENFRQKTIIDEQVARRQIGELRDELKVTRQFLNRLSEKGSSDNQGKML
ncbi:MAG: hypothetical protein P8J51_01515 [Dehalococcoidia bacterium]|nr:hypothetical protein [Dehalococcoidia bacterium]